MIKLLGANSYWVWTLYQTSHLAFDAWVDVATSIFRNWALKILSTCLHLQRKQPWIVTDSRVILPACSSSERELKTWGQCPSLLLISCVTLGQWTNLSASQIYPIVKRCHGITVEGWMRFLNAQENTCLVEIHNLALSARKFWDC